MLGMSSQLQVATAPDTIVPATSVPQTSFSPPPLNLRANVRANSLTPPLVSN